MEGIRYTDSPQEPSQPSEVSASSEAFTGGVDETMLTPTDKSALSDIPPQRPEDITDGSSVEQPLPDPEVDLQAVAGKLAAAHTVEVGDSDTADTSHQRYSTQRHPRIEAVRTAKEADLAARGEPPRRWGHGQPARIIQALHEKGFDVAGTVPVEMVKERQVVGLLSQGMTSKEVAEQTGLSQARIAQITGEIVDYVHYAVPAESLPSELPDNYLYPTGSFIGEVDTSTASQVADRLKEIVAEGGKSVAELSEILGVGWSEATIYNALSGRTLPSAGKVRRIVEAAGGDATAFMSEYEAVLQAARLSEEQGGALASKQGEMESTRADDAQQPIGRRWAPNQPRHILQHLDEIGFDVAPFMRVQSDPELSPGNRRLLEAVLSSQQTIDVAAQTGHEMSAITRLAERMVGRIAEYARDHPMPEGITPEFFEPKGTSLDRSAEVSPGSVSFVLNDAIAERGLVGKELAAELHISPSQLTRILRGQRMPVWTIKALIDRLFGDNPEYARSLHEQNMQEAALRREKMKGT